MPVGEAVSCGLALGVVAFAPLVGAHEAGRCGMAPAAVVQIGAGGSTGVVAAAILGAALELVDDKAPTEADAATTETTRIVRPSARPMPYSP
jgi:hypothetical protein